MIWQTKKLGEVCDIVGGGTPDTKVKMYWGNDVFLVTPKDLGKVHTTEISVSERKISKFGLENSSAKILPKGSVILSSRAPIGYVAINSTEMATNQGCRSFVCKDVIFNKFLYYFLKSNTILLNKLGSGTTFKEISGSTLKLIQINIPSIAEQKHIVKILDEAFVAISKVKENTEKNLQNSRELFELYLTNIFADPRNTWEEHLLGDIYDVRDGTHDSPKYQKNGYPLVTSKNLKNGEIDLDNIKYISETDYIKINERSKVNKGDILFAMIGTIGNPVVVKLDPEFAIKNVALYKIPNNQSSNFLKYYLDSKFVINKMKDEAKGTTQKFVGLGYLRNFKIKLPKLLEQREIVAKLDILSAETKKLEEIYKQKLVLLEELKKSLLHQAFSGQL